MQQQKICWFGLDENDDLSEYGDDIEEPKREAPKYYTNYTRDEMAEALERLYQPDEYFCYSGWQMPDIY